ncbi:CrcB family protein [Streptomyces sp. NRRL S-87]|uniref:fluoride efflux transporter FluC n=1 Tax=Streptomyces sp. NRRL S-87 TaxID=1463920 RepID=UPI0004BFA7EA|nr:CrcB family protein [Streptomyces sp. NRRL S-87]
MTRPVPGAEAIDPDVDLHVPAQRVERQGPVLAAVSAGGVLGALARYGLVLAFPAGPGDFPWATFAVNVAGCGLIGVLMVLISEGGRSAHPLVRPFLGVGVLGGFTTFSTYAVDVSRLLDRGAAGTALAYAAGTLAGALGAVWLAASTARALVARRAGAPRGEDGR